MKAVVLTEERELALVDRDAPMPSPGELAIDVEACGICGTDLHADKIEMFRPPVVIGHEFSGIVTGWGDGVDGWQVGDRVAVNPMADLCGECAACRAGHANRCQVAIYERSIGVSRDGAMAESVVVPATLAHRLPPEVGPLAGAWVEPLAVAVRAVDRSPTSAGDHVVIFGGGPIGLLIAQVLRVRGLQKILVVEPDGSRRAVAIELGMEAVAPGGEPPSEFAGAFECSGHPDAFRAAVTAVRAGGFVRLVGAATSPVQFDSIPLLHKELTVSTSFIYVDEYPEAIKLLASGAVDVESLTTAHVPLDRFEDAFSAMRGGGAIKALVMVAASGGAR